MNRRPKTSVATRRRRKSALERNLPKRHKRRPAFDSFLPKVEQKKQKRNIAAISPENGIHSKEWALSITPQPEECRLFNQATEIRMKIWEYALEDLDEAIRPSKRGSKFICTINSKTAPYLASLPLLCCQAYIDITGSGLVYAKKTFQFETTTDLTTYLPCINPFLKDQIRSISVHRYMNFESMSWRSVIWNILTSCRGLKQFELVIWVKIESRVTKQTAMRFFSMLGNSKYWRGLHGCDTFSLDVEPYTRDHIDDMTQFMVYHGDLHRRLKGKMDEYILRKD